VQCFDDMLIFFSRDFDGTHNRMINRRFGWVRDLKYQHPIKPRQSPPKPVDHIMKKPARTRVEVGLSFEDFTRGWKAHIYNGTETQHPWEVTYGSTLHPRGLQSSESRKLIRDAIMPAYAFLINVLSFLAETSPNTKPKRNERWPIFAIWHTSLSLYTPFPPKHNYKPIYIIYTNPPKPSHP
jgi:hypothetical protein